MENWRTEEAVDSLGVQLKDKRSILLTVVCILTWVGCAFPLVITAMSFFKTRDITRAFSGMGAYSNLWFYLDWLVFPILCALGAVFMFRLKRWGFWIYCLGQIPPIIYSVYHIIALTKSLGSGVFFGLLVNCLAIGFVIIYAVEMSKLSRKPVSTDF
jgi:hypothetical protein